jgi:hypothetical protein
MDQDPRMSFVNRAFALVVIGVMVGVLGASSFADAAGIASDDGGNHTTARVVCGIVLGLATISLTIVAGHFSRLGIAAIRQSSRRPSQNVAITLIVCGAACFLMAMAFEWYVVASSRVIRPAVGESGGSATINLPGMEQKATISVTGTGAVRMGTAASPFGHVMALTCFLAGAVLIGLGVWSSISGKPEGYAHSATIPAA